MMSHPHRSPLWTLLALLVVAVAMTAPWAKAQVADSSGTGSGDLQLGFEDRVEVAEVYVDVLVTDAEGNVVRDLAAEDFVVEEDGIPVEVTSVSYYTTRYRDVSGPEASAVRVEEGAVDEVPSSRYFLFFFHDQTRFSRFGGRLLRQQVRAARDSARWVETEMQPSDWVAVVSYDTALRVHQDFTQDRDALVRALHRVGVGKRPEPPRARGERRRELGILSRLPTGRELASASDDIHPALELVAESLGYLVGRKVLVLFTTGFGDERGFDAVADEELYPPLEAALNDHNVAVYPVDLTPAGRPPAQEEFLARLAHDTGGVYDPDFSGFLAPLADVAAENHGYYLITYRSARTAGESGYQRLEVRVTDPELTVRARTGYRY